jgi:hypothetical protein
MLHFGQPKQKTTEDRTGLGYTAVGAGLRSPGHAGGKGSLWACDSLVDHASKRSRLGSLHFWIWSCGEIILRHVRDFRTYKKQLFLERKKK